MSIVKSVLTATVGGASYAGLRNVVAGIGGDAFGACLLHYLHAVCGADHCVAYELDWHAPPSALVACSLDGSELAQQRMRAYTSRYWDRDPVVPRLPSRREGEEPAVVRIDLAQLPVDFRSALYPQMRDRVMLVGGNPGSTCLLSIVRSDATRPLTDDDMARLGDCAGLLISMLSRHAELALHKSRPTQALRSLSEIEARLMAADALPRREAQVCARVLYGLSTVGISLDLGIGTESVKTYRKRAYQRLCIGSERELLTWYLELWSGRSDHLQPAKRVH